MQSILKNLNGKRRVLIAAGGAFQWVVVSNAIHARKIVLDAKKECDLVGDTADVLIPLPNLTTFELLDQARGLHPQFAAAEPYIAQSSTDDGYGQTPVIAAAALALRGNLTNLLKSQILDKMTVDTGGEVSPVEIIVGSSLGGATGNGTAITVARTMCNVIHNHTEAEVKLQYFVIGAMTFLTIGPNIERNSAAVIEVVGEVSDRTHHKRQYNSAIFAELPIVLKDKITRDMLVSQLAQAWYSAQVQEVANRPRSNEDQSKSQIGNMTILRPAWFGYVTPQTIAAGAKARYQPMLAKLLQTPASTTVEVKMEVVEKKIEEQWSDEALIGQLDLGITDPNMGEYIVPMGPTYTVSFQVDKQSVDGFIGKMPNTYDGFQLAMKRSRALISVLEAQIAERNQQIAELDIEGAKETVLKKYQAAMKKGLLGSFTTFKKTETREAEFEQALLDYREAYRNQARLQAEIKTLKEALDRANDLLRLRFVEPITRLINVMNEVVEGEVIGLEFAPIDNILADLLSLEKKNVIKYLEAHTLTKMSLKALAAMINVGDNPQEILEQMLKGKPIYEAPNWGAAERADAPEIFLIVPQISDPDLELLREYAGSGVHILRSDQTAAGTAAIRILKYPVNKQSDVITQFYRSNAESVLNDPNERNLVLIPDAKLATI